MKVNNATEYFESEAAYKAPHITTRTVFKIYNPGSGGWHPDHFETKEAAIEQAKKKSTVKSEENRKYWDAQEAVIQKVTTIVEIVRIVRPDEKV